MEDRHYGSPVLHGGKFVTKRHVKNTFIFSVDTGPQ